MSGTANHRCGIAINNKGIRFNRVIGVNSSISRLTRGFIPRACGSPAYLTRKCRCNLYSEYNSVSSVHPVTGLPRAVPRG